MLDANASGQKVRMSSSEQLGHCNGPLPLLSRETCLENMKVSPAFGPRVAIHPEERRL